MTFEVNESIQVLDSTGVWRTGTILSKELDKFIIHFQSLSSKHDIECSKGDLLPLILKFVSNKHFIQ